MVADQMSWLEEVARESKHAAGFRRFHLDNPGVHMALLQMLARMKRRGRVRIGMGMLFEVLRWEYYLNSNSDEEFKLNNNYRAYYTRLIKHTHPMLGDMLTSRTSMADEDEQ